MLPVELSEQIQKLLPSYLPWTLPHRLPTVIYNLNQSPPEILSSLQMLRTAGLDLYIRGTLEGIKDSNRYRLREGNISAYLTPTTIEIYDGLRLAYQLAGHPDDFMVVAWYPNGYKEESYQQGQKVLEEEYLDGVLVMSQTPEMVQYFAHAEQRSGYDYSPSYSYFDYEGPFQREYDLVPEPYETVRLVGNHRYEYNRRGTIKKIY